MVKIQENDGQKFVTLPKELATAMGWEKGDDLQFSVFSSKELLVKKK